jgi:hypothetical protein
MRNGTGNGCRGQTLAVTKDGVRGLRDLTKDQLGSLLKAAHREYALRFPRGRPIPMPEGVRIIKSSDLAMVAFLDDNGVPVIGVQPNNDPNSGRHQFAVFVLADMDGNADRLRLAFISSEFARCDSKIRALKKQAQQFRYENRG